MNRVYSHLSSFLSGALAVALAVILVLLKTTRPVINTTSYVEKVENSLKKMKTQGQDNESSMAVGLPVAKEKKTRKILGIIKRKQKKQ